MTAFGPIAIRWEPLVWVVAPGHHDRRQFRGAPAIEHQAPARLQLHRPRRLRAGRRDRASPETGTAAAMFYLAAYAFMNIGASPSSRYFARKGEKYVDVDDFNGLAQRQPAMAAMLSIFLLSLIGVPLTGGFFGKFYIFKAALDVELGLAHRARPAEQRRGGVLLLCASWS